MASNHYATIFLDIGGVILSNGWDHQLRMKAAEDFHLDFAEMNKRHSLTFDTYEIGKISLDTYLDRVVFYTSRPFTHAEFKEFMFNQSHSYPEMHNLILELKKWHSIRVVAVTNEGKELMEDRIKKFHLKDMIDLFICSGFVGLRKPDIAIYRLALDIAQVKPQEVVYIDDRPMLAEIGSQIGMQAIHHTSFEQTQKLLNDFFQKE